MAIETWKILTALQILSCNFLNVYIVLLQLNPGKDQKLLHQLEFRSYQVLTIRTFSSTVASTSSLSSVSSSVKEVGPDN